MIQIIEYCSENHPRLSHVFKACGFEHPTLPYLREGSDGIRFSGWVIPNDFSDTITLTIVVGGVVVQTHTLGVLRPDVATAHDISIAEPTFGFSFSFVSDRSYEINIGNGVTALTIWKVSIPDRTLPRSDSDLSTDCELEIFAKTATADPFNFQNHIVVQHIEDVVASGEIYAISSPDISRLPKTITALRSPTWSIDATIQSLQNGELQLPSPWSDRPSRCLRSIAVDDFNFLVFSDERNIFLVVQHCTVVCVAFPSLFCIVSLADRSWTEEARRRIPRALKELAASCRDIHHRQSTYMGSLTAQFRPYHYFYDYLYGIELLATRFGDLNRLRHYAIQGADFVDVGQIFESTLPTTTLVDQELNRLTREGGFLIAPCVQFCTTQSTQVMKSLDRRLVSHFGHKEISPKFLPLSASESVFPILWVGVSSEKRSWTEQASGLVRLIGELKQDYPDIMVVVDGRTFPRHPTASDRANESRDDRVFKMLLESHPSVKFIRAIGLTAAEKIAIANFCHFFITSYATDSLYPSRICGKPGVTHAPRAMGTARSLHVHHDILEIPEEVISDLTVDINAPWHLTSYSIHWEEVLRTVRRLIATRFDAQISQPAGYSNDSD